MLIEVIRYLNLQHSKIGKINIVRSNALNTFLFVLFQSQFLMLYLLEIKAQRKVKIYIVNADNADNIDSEGCEGCSSF